MSRRVKVFSFLLWVTALAGAAVAQTGDAFLGDIQALTSSPHRLSGTPEARAAADYIDRRLRGIGITDVCRLGMQVWQTKVDRCELKVDGKVVALLPLRPNIFVSPVTPPEGLSGPMIYAGRGETADYGTRSAEGSIVVLDYDSFDNWQRAFGMGAKAVIFLGDRTTTPAAPKFVGVPANYVRLYASPEAQQMMDFRRDWPQATVISQVPWVQMEGENVLAFLPGTNPVFDAGRGPETIVLAVNYDTFGVVPQDSRGARGAANVAALLDTAQYLVKNRPRRNVLFMFLDNQARYHQGARAVYSELMGNRGRIKAVVEEHRRHLEFVAKIRALLEGPQRLEGPSNVRNAAIAALKSQAEFIASDLQQKISDLRVEIGRHQDPVDQTLQGRKDDLSAQAMEWDNARRSLHAGTPERIPAALYNELRERALGKLNRQVAGLQATVKEDEQAQRLRQSLGAGWIALHLHYNFSDDGPTWAPVPGDSSNDTFWGADGGSDKPGYYSRVLAALRAAASQLPGDAAFGGEAIVEPSAALRYTTGKFVSSGTAAGTYGIYNMSFITGNDGRRRDGHPADTVENLNWEKIYDFSRASEKLVHALADGEQLSLPRTFGDKSLDMPTRWSNGQSSGNFAGLSASGSISEDRPAEGAMMAVWAYWPAPPRLWDGLSSAVAMPFFDRFSLEAVDADGRFGLFGLRKDLFSQYVTLGGMFDPEGRISAISNQNSLSTQASAITRVNLIPATGYTVPFPLLGEMEKASFSEADKAPFHVLGAETDASLPLARTMSGQLENTGFFYIVSNSPVERVKIFQKKGPVLMNGTARRPLGEGFALAEWEAPPAADRITAEDLWRINESRLGILRTHGVNSAALETLHGRSLRALDAARKADTIEKKESALAESTLLSRRVYPELRDSMDDLVRGIVILLLLTIPFAFVMERLVFCSSSVYHRIAGFGAIFVATFGLLFVMHPGFAIAPAPLIIFLAFAIILLSSLVIFIVVRKFKDELHATQGQAHRLHQLTVSRMGTMLAAINMGMSTMRRRPTRTWLTCITVVLLTFTILTFASFSSGVGLRAVYEGPSSENPEAGVLTRQVDYTPMPVNLLPLLHGLARDGELIASQWWLYRGNSDQAPFSVARVDNGQAASFESVMGWVPAELERWPQLAAVLEGADAASKREALEKGGVFLPAAARDRLALKPGDPILVNGGEAFFAGTFDTSALQRLKNIDGRSIVPADFIAAAALKPQDVLVEEKRNIEEMSQRDVVRLSPEQVCIASAARVRAQGGGLFLVTLYLPKGADAERAGRRIAEMVPTPVWTRGSDGIERLIFTRINSVQGQFALLVPVILGGLIIFGTLLGSIADREREIYTFSALGLAPSHVGFLFFAEAAVYAIAGGMGGLLLAQAVALGASALARMGLIHAPTLDFSSGNALFAGAAVMTTVMVSAAYPAVRASRSANPGVQRAWKLPKPEGDVLSMVFPFTVSAYDITGLVSFLAEHFRAHEDAGLGKFAAWDVRIGRGGEHGALALSARLALAPFDLGVTQDFMLMARPSEIPGVDEVIVRAERKSGASSDWVRSNRVFVQDLRRQFLLWRALTSEAMENYRMQTLLALGEKPAQPTSTDTQEVLT